MADTEDYTTDAPSSANFSFDSTNHQLNGQRDFILRGCVFGAMVFIGISLNILTIIGFSGVKKKSSHTFLLQCLSAADALFLLMLFLEHSIWLFFQFFQTFTMCEYSDIYFKTNFFFGGMLRLSHDLVMWAVVLVTTDRFVAIYAATRAHKYCQIKVAAIAFGIAVIYVSAFNAHDFVLNKFTSKSTNTSSNQSAYDMLNCNIEYVSASSKEFKQIYYYVDSLLNLVIPMVCVVVLDCGMIMALRQSRIRMGRRRDEASSSATVILVLLATSFVIFQFPQLIHNIYQAIGPHVYSFELAYVSVFFQALNSFSNFFIYILIGRSFRAALITSIKDMSMCCIPKKYRRTHQRPDYTKATESKLSMSLSPNSYRC